MKTNKRGEAEIFGVIFLFVIIIIIALVSVFFRYGNETITSEKITEASIEFVGQGASREKYLFTEDNVYAIQDRLWAGKTRSMDTYRKAKANEGKVCDVKSIGTRIGLFSMYKSAIEITNCKEDIGIKQTEELQ